MLANVFGVESERTVCSIRIGKRKRTFLSCVPLLIKRAREITKFHVAVMYIKRDSTCKVVVFLILTYNVFAVVYVKS